MSVNERKLGQRKIEEKRTIEPALLKRAAVVRTIFSYGRGFFGDLQKFHWQVKSFTKIFSCVADMCGVNLA